MYNASTILPDFPAYIGKTPAYLHGLYETVAGRMLLQPLVCRPFSVLAGKVMDSSLSTKIIPSFIKNAMIPMEEYENAEYRSFNEFFTRKIKEECRPIDQNHDHLISPADAKVCVYPITQDAVFKIKGVPYSVEHLLCSARLAQNYDGGWCYIFRLSVDDYHRYCFPDSGVRTRHVHIPGTYHTVHPIALNYADIYRQNAREYAVLRTHHFGDVVMMQVGAMLVGRIKNLDTSRRFSRGEEAGCFDYGGSTVVLLVKKNTLIPHPQLISRSAESIESVVKMGQCVGVSCASAKEN